jgi:hypothetical protein
MKEMIIKIPEDATELVTELVEKLGGTIKVEEKISSKKKNRKRRKKVWDMISYLANGKILMLTPEKSEKNYGEGIKSNC